MNSPKSAAFGAMREDELFEAAKAAAGALWIWSGMSMNIRRLPVVNFAAGGVATPADAALMMQLGAEGVFVGSGIFKSGNPAKRAAAIVKAVTNYTDAKLLGRTVRGSWRSHGRHQRTARSQLLMAERGK